MTGSGRAAEMGILFRGGEQLERAYKTDTVIFDKTGTLTCGMADDGEIIRSDAKDAVEKLKAAGIDVWMISGDKEVKAKRVAGLLGIENVSWEVKPSDKADAVKKASGRGAARCHGRRRDQRLPRSCLRRYRHCRRKRKPI